MRVGLKLVREGKAKGFVTAGNTGAAMATAKMVLGALPGVDRPALATPMPSSTGNPCVLLDVGANVDCKAHNLEQFAVMGADVRTQRARRSLIRASICFRLVRKRARATI